MLKEQMDAAIAHLEAEVRERFPGGRLLKHTFSVAETCRETARRLGRSDTTPEAAYLAGLAHDLFKDRRHDELRELVRSESVPIDRHSWLLGGGLLHAPAAAHYLRSRLGVRDAGLLGAVYYHTTGRAGAGVLERILFCADYLDASRPKRSAEPGLESLRNKLKSSLNEVYGEVIRRKLVYTLSKGRPLHPSGVAAWNELFALKT